MSRIIFLHGASSSGKTTIARALQARAEAPFWHVSIDHLRDSGIVPMDRFRGGDFDWHTHRLAIFDGLHRSLAAYADAGNDLIAEHILDMPGSLPQLQGLLKHHDVLFVGVHCRLPVLIARERIRKNRALGSAEQDYGIIHIGRTYDLEVDGENDPDTNAVAILAALRSGRRRSEFS